MKVFGKHLTKQLPKPSGSLTSMEGLQVVARINHVPLLYLLLDQLQLRISHQLLGVAIPAAVTG